MNSPEHDQLPDKEIQFNKEAIELYDKIMKYKIMIKIKQPALKLKKIGLMTRLLNLILSTVRKVHCE